MPSWTVIAGLLTFFTTIFLYLLNRTLQKYFPTIQEKLTIKKTGFEADKVFADAKMVEWQLTDQVKKMVIEETKDLRDLIVDQKLEHAEEIEEYVSRINEERKEKEAIADQLRKAQKLAEEVSQQLQDAKREITNLKQRVSELESKQS